MRRSPYGIAVTTVILSLVVLAGCASNQTTKIETVSQFTPPKGAKPAPQGEIGRGECWQRDVRPSGGKKVAGFATDTGPEDAATWLKSHKDEVDRYDAWLNSHKAYYLVYELVRDWDNLSATDRVTAYVSKTEAVRLIQPMHVQNTYCKGLKVHMWKIQTLPVGEWVFFVPGHELGTADPRLAFKAVCGNPLLPPGRPKPTPSPSPSTSTPHPRCTSCSTPTLEPKIPAKEPNSRGKAPEGGDNNENQGSGGKKSYTTNPAEPYHSPKPPAKHKPPVGSTPTSHSAPPPESGSNSDNGDANEDDGGGF